MSTIAPFFLSDLASLASRLLPLHKVQAIDRPFVHWLSKTSKDEGSEHQKDAARLFAQLTEDRFMDSFALGGKYAPSGPAGHPVYGSADWRSEIENESTRQSYWEWVLSQMDQDFCDLD